ncbi:glycosyltransferase [Endozoicomonas atrinae]|uniref:glycosyltransferase n=1 Tax=Endozoicomonas atrinae TaxID=1333660 RepID=UPI003AFF85DE
MSQRKRILINHLSAPANKITGITNYLFFLLDELLKNQDFEYILLTCWNQKELPEMLNNRGLQVITEKEIQSQPFALLRQHLLIPKLIKEYKIDLEFVPSPGGCLFSLHPRIIVVHDLYMKVLKEHYKPMHRLWWNLFFPIKARTAKQIICVSKNTENDLHEYYPYTKNKSIAIPNGPCLKADENYQMENKENFGVFVANVTPNKGAKTLIGVMIISGV